MPLPEDFERRVREIAERAEAEIAAIQERTDDARAGEQEIRDGAEARMQRRLDRHARERFTSKRRPTFPTSTTSNKEDNLDMPSRKENVGEVARQSRQKLATAKPGRIKSDPAADLAPAMTPRLRQITAGPSVTIVGGRGI